MQRVYSAIIFFVGIMLMSCSQSVKVLTADGVSTALSSAIVTTLSCSNISAVQTDVTAQVNSWFSIQAQTQKGGLLQSLCTTSIAQIIPSLIGSTVPATWGCSVTLVKDVTNVLATVACAAIPD